MSKVSVVLTTYNNLPYLKLCLRILREHSLPETEILIHVDGSTDGTAEWLEREGYDYVFEKHQGIYHGFNEAISRASGEYVALFADDMIVFSNWDKTLLRYAKKYRALASRLVEPKFGSFLPLMDFGKTHDTFDERGFMDYAKKISKDTVIPWKTVGANFFNRELFWETGGYDENFSPYGFGDTDLLFRIKIEYPETEFLQCLSSIIYHFQTISKAKFSEDEKKEINTKNMTYFRKKWGASVDGMHKGLGI